MALAERFDSPGTPTTLGPLKLYGGLVTVINAQVSLKVDQPVTSQECFAPPPSVSSIKTESQTNQSNIQSLKNRNSNINIAEQNTSSDLPAINLKADKKYSPSLAINTENKHAAEIDRDFKGLRDVWEKLSIENGWHLHGKEGNKNRNFNAWASALKTTMSTTKSQNQHAVKISIRGGGHSTKELATATTSQTSSAEKKQTIVANLSDLAKPLMDDENMSSNSYDDTIPETPSMSNFEIVPPTKYNRDGHVMKPGCDIIVCAVKTFTVNGHKVHEIDLRCKECTSSFILTAAHECADDDDVVTLPSPLEKTNEAEHQNKEIQWSRKINIKESGLEWLRDETTEYVNIVI